ncbi:tetraacyldisaccharide 4'-kinase [Oxalobacter vibrioformis]|uniref:Tetraacyldisaccharide 4'-kinase n=1 Tax=Oxalobacter vibrioformis TaxID=933080 RepID=A0A9E9LT93_9BURK|nr:tetraacyldisaccharide 4'-kinase [Oxalobacter vibrioformis]WAW09230.1 tetraacyldisaccharide 4'-kinase [Oxalobacter vibrioformis]
MKSSPKTDWMAIWQDRGRLAGLLWPLSLLFRLVVWARRKAYQAGFFKSSKLPVPVVVVGNIFIGGTGKTPLVIWLAKALTRAGFHPGVVSRGYGAKGKLPEEVLPDSLPGNTGDEPLLIRLNAGCPVVVGKKRVDAARLLLERHPDVNVIISDDGLQHYAMQRDIEMVLFDGRGAGNGWMLPAGPLREPVSRRRDFTVVNSMNYPAPGNLIYSPDIFLMQLAGDTAEMLMDRSRRMTLAELSESGRHGRLRIAAVAGIGNPARFFVMLKTARLEVQTCPLPDHFDYASNPFEKMDADIILVTEKDAVKCARIAAIAKDTRIWVVPVRAQLDDGLEQKIVEKCREYGTA